LTTNAAHNVFLDLSSNGGIVLLIPYLALIYLTLVSIKRILKFGQNSNCLILGVISAWFAFQAQALISINQIGLMIWGWVLTGALISYDRFSKTSEESNASNSKIMKSARKDLRNVISPSLIASIGAIFGLFIAAPAINADMTWQRANQSQNLVNFEAALKPTFMNPASSLKYAQAVDTLQRSNFVAIAHKYALIAVKFNPDFFDAWKQLYYLPTSSQMEKEEALTNMKRLDPHNPDVTQVR
jgi:hypothetical protein